LANLNEKEICRGLKCGTMIVTGVTEELESSITIQNESFSDVYDLHSEVGRYV